ncbi:MAG TPA: glycosyltransferase family 4 protein [Clostridia bacterium]|nr:glycosyltransferase family 4 protein [Clostridia bacterium]
MSQRISVLQYTNTIVRGGVEEHILVLLRGLNRDMFKLSFACPPELASQMRADVPRDVDFIEIPIFRFWRLGEARQFATLLRSRGVQLLHSHMFQSSRMASPIASFAGVPAIIETPHVRESWRNRWPRSSYLPDRMLARCVDRFIAISYANAKYLVAEKGLPGDKIRVVQNSCDLKRFSAPLAANPQLRHSVGASESDPLVLVVARLEPQKGHRVLLESLPQVVREWPSLKVVCIGDGILRQELLQRADALGVTKNISFLGFQANVPEWLATADFCVLPSFYEGLPLVALECLAAGRAMLATAVDGTPEVIQHEVTGLLVPPGDSAALARQMLRLIADPELRKRLGATGRQFVFRQFREERQIKETEQVYYELCKAKLPQSLCPAPPAEFSEPSRDEATSIA